MFLFGVWWIIFVINIVEIFIIIFDVVYVVDIGRVKEKRYDLERYMLSFVFVWVGLSNLN